MYLKLKSPLQMSAIPKHAFGATANRSQFRVAIIDDQPFPYTEDLRKHGYALTELGDIQDLAAVAEYPILACDIMGVGTRLGTAYQGAHVLAEVRRRYPSKFLIAYSGGTFGPTYKKYWDQVDVFLRRDGGFDQWIDVLDQGIVTLGDPVQAWRRIRKLLLDSDVSAFDVYLLEEAYIKSILKKESYHLEKELGRVKKRTSRQEIIETVGAGLITAVKLYIHAIS